MSMFKMRMEDFFVVCFTTCAHSSVLQIPDMSLHYYEHIVLLSKILTRAPNVDASSTENSPQQTITPFD